MEALDRFKRMFRFLWNKFDMSCFETIIRLSHARQLGHLDIIFFKNIFSIKRNRSKPVLLSTINNEIINSNITCIYIFLFLYF